MIKLTSKELKQKILGAQTLWGDGIINIGKSFLENKDYIKKTETFIDSLYHFKKGKIFEKASKKGIAIHKEMEKALNLAEHTNEGDIVGDKGTVNNSIVINQWYPLSGLKDSHQEKLNKGAVQVKVKLILKTVSESGALTEFFSASEISAILKSVEAQFEHMRLQLQDLSTKRDS